MPSFDLYRSRCKSTKINLSRAAYLNFFFAVDIKDADGKFLVRVFEYREHHRFDTAFRMIEKKPHGFHCGFGGQTLGERYPPVETQQKINIL